MPEICRTPLEDTLLLMKDMGIKNVETFPFPTQPERNSIDAALHILTALGAVDKQKEITTLGRAMRHYPVGVRYAKMLVLALEKKEILGLMVGVISALTGRSPIIRPEELLMGGKKEEKKLRKKKRLKKRRRKRRARVGSDGVCSRTEIRQCRESLLLWRDALSDALSLLRLFGAYLHAPSPSLFCKQHFLREKVLLLLPVHSRRCARWQSCADRSRAFSHSRTLR